MNIIKRITLPAILTLALLAFMGCASTDPTPAFEDVQADVGHRIGSEVYWNQDATQDPAVHNRVQVMLQKPLTSDAAVQVALLHNPDLQATYQKLGIAQAQLVAAGLLRNPVFSGNVKLSALAGGGPGQVVELSVTQNFLDILFIPLRKSVARAELNAAKQEVTAAVLNVAGDTRRAYYTCQADLQTVEMMEQVAQSTEASLAVARAMRQAGNVPVIDVDRQLAMYQRARLDLNAAQEASLASRERLIRKMGLWGADAAELKLQGRLPEAPEQAMKTDGLVKEALSHSVDLAAARAKGEALARGVGLSGLSGVFEELTAGAAAEGDDGHWFVGPSGSISIPIFNFGQAASAEAKARVRMALWQYADMAVRIRSLTRAQVVHLNAARDRASYMKKDLLPTTQRVVEQAQLQCNAMQIGVFNLLDARREQINIGREYIRALRDYWLARTDLDQTLAGVMPSLSMRSSSSVSD